MTTIPRMRAAVLLLAVSACAVEPGIDDAPSPLAASSSRVTAESAARVLCEREWCDPRAPTGQLETCVAQWTDTLCSLTGCKGSYAGPDQTTCLAGLRAEADSCTCWPRHTDGRVCGGGAEAGTVPAGCSVATFDPRSYR